MVILTRAQAIMLCTFLLGMSNAVIADVNFPDPSGIYKGMCSTPVTNPSSVFCDDETFQDFFASEYGGAKNCSNSLIVRSTAFVDGGSNLNLQSQVEGQWLACNIYLASHYSDPD